MTERVFVGRRKTAVARVVLKQGSGVVTVNAKKFEDYFPQETMRTDVSAPFVVTDNMGKFDASVNVYGGGPSGQAQAVRLAIARALIENDPELRPKLKSAGFLTRDPRMVERKKYGRPKARKRFQFSKR